ncbi:LPXTG cell wall anchor domain-containing protein [Streptomyces xantholiticus]|nr:LPXTG cell wall anchor domain-containing protein [Streptomyces xantholiticus]
MGEQVSPLSLGIGMALMGLGIGFLGVRLRRR